jgi:CRISPR system Cascade subunit CasB
MSKPYTVFWEDSHQKLRDWWETLDHDRGARAELRRAESPADVLLTQGFRSLCRTLAGYWTQESRLLALAAVGGILANVKDNSEQTKGKIQSFAAQCAAFSDRGGDKPIVSEWRFSQLQKSRTLDELYTRMNRTVKLLGGKANIVSIADGVLLWAKEMVEGEVDTDPRNRILVRWGLDYFQNLPN